VETNSTREIPILFWRYVIVHALLITVICTTSCFAQENIVPFSQPEQDVSKPLRVETVRMDQGAELLTFFFKGNAANGNQPDPPDTPLFSVLRDTLSSPNTDIHRLRYVWIHTYAQPSVRQKFAASIPFFYSRFGNAPISADRLPSPVIDFTRSQVPRQLASLALQNLYFDPRLSLLEAVLRRYNERQSEYLRLQLRRVSTALDSEDFLQDGSVFSTMERRQLQRRLVETEKPLGSLLPDDKLQQFYLKQMMALRQACGKNWELLRQRAEAEGLFFEPLLLPDGTATHALLLVAREDLQNNETQAFDGRFLNISKPWGDPALLNWNGVTEIRYLDSDGRRTDVAAEASRRLELIPLALYGLDHPKVPILLIDFRNPLNAKRRELSREAKDYLESKFSMGPGFSRTLVNGGKAAFGFITHKRGMDLFQQSRADSYSRLKMVLSANHSLSHPMLADIGRRLEHVAINPMENDWKSEIQLAQTQYKSLLAYANRSDGLQADIDRARRAEMMSGSHSTAAQNLFKVGALSTFGTYTHREDEIPETDSILESRRLYVKQEVYLRDVLKSQSPIEVSWDMSKVRGALEGLLGSPWLSDNRAAEVTAQLFRKTLDTETRERCLNALVQLNRRYAQTELARLAADRNTDATWRTLITQYLDRLNSQPDAAPAKLAVSSEAAASND